MTLLVGAGADLNAAAPEGLTAAHVAAQADAVASFEVLVAAGADMGATSGNGMNALHHAADLGSVGVIEYVAGQGVDLDVRSEVVTQGHGHPRDRGATALGIAAHAGQLDAVETLLALGRASRACPRPDTRPCCSPSSPVIRLKSLPSSSTRAPIRESKLRVMRAVARASPAMPWSGHAG